MCYLGTHINNRFSRAVERLMTLGREYRTGRQKECHDRRQDDRDHWRLDRHRPGMCSSSGWSGAGLSLGMLLKYLAIGMVLLEFSITLLLTGLGLQHPSDNRYW